MKKFYLIIIFFILSINSLHAYSVNYGGQNIEVKVKNGIAIYDNNIFQGFNNTNYSSPSVGTYNFFDFYNQCHIDSTHNFTWICDNYSNIPSYTGIYLYAYRDSALNEWRVGANYMINGSDQFAYNHEKTDVQNETNGGINLIYFFQNTAYVNNVVLSGTQLAVTVNLQYDFPYQYKDKTFYFNIENLTGIPNETCTDGKLNQNETGIDVGGVCGNNSFQYSGTYGAGDNIQCATRTYTNPGTTTWITDFGTLTATPWAGASDVEGGLGFQDTQNGGLDTDYFRGIYFASGSTVPHEVMTWGNTTQIANVEYLPERVTPMSSKDPRVKVVSKRGGVLREFDVVQLKYNSSQNTGGHAEFGTYQGNGGAPIPYTGVYRPCTDNGDNTCTIVANKTAKYADVHFYSGLTGLRIGKAGASINKTVCENSSYSCKWTYSSTATGGYVCNGIDLAANGSSFTEGDCGISPEGYCMPISSYRNPTANEHAVLDGSGNVIGIAPGATEGTSSVESQITDDIFSCPQYKDWTDSVKCVIQVFKNAYGLTKTAINTTTSDGDKTVVGKLKQIGNTGSTVSFGKFSTGGVNLADSMYRGTWNKAFDNSDSLTQFGRTALFGAIMMLILAIALLFYYISSRK